MPDSAENEPCYGLTLEREAPNATFSAARPFQLACRSQFWDHPNVNTERKQKVFISRTTKGRTRIAEHVTAVLLERDIEIDPIS